MKKQDEVLAFIKGFQQANGGLPPTRREIMQGCDVKSTSMVNYYLMRLEDEGRIELLDKGKSRNIIVLEH